MDEEQLRHNFLERRRLADREQDPLERPNPLRGLRHVFGTAPVEPPPLTEDRYAEYEAQLAAAPEVVDDRRWSMGQIMAAMVVCDVTGDQAKAIREVLAHLLTVAP